MSRTQWCQCDPKIQRLDDKSRCLVCGLHDHEALLQRIGKEDAAEVNSWPEWRRNPTQVSRAERDRAREELLKSDD
jgi:hypothetical protein